MVETVIESTSILEKNSLNERKKTTYQTFALAEIRIK